MSAALSDNLLQPLFPSTCRFRRFGGLGIRANHEFLLDEVLGPGTPGGNALRNAVSEG